MSEDILMQIPNVKYKKREGVLDITSNGISWEAYKVPGESRSDLMSNLDLSFTDIRSQRTSPESRINLQLQITLYSSNTYVFHFKTAQECGKTEKEYKEQRLRLKEILSEQLPLHRSKTNDKLEDKITFLQNNDHLYMMYKDLVVSKVISADDFWKLKTVQTLVDKYNSNLATESNLAIEFLKKQNQMNNSSVAVSSNFLSNIKLTDKGCKYTLTQELINDIFKAYPEVKKSHQVFVKETREFTEYEFWRFFFTSHYYKRDETKKTKNDLFSQFRLDKNKNKLNQTKLNNLGKPVEKVQKYDDSLAATDNLMWLENYNHIKAVETSEMDKILEPRDFITSISNSVIQKSDISGTNISNSKKSRDLLKNINTHSMSVLGSQYRKKVEISELEKENKILKRKKEDLDDHVEESDHLYHKIAKLEYMANYSGKNEYNLVKNEYGQMVYQAQLDPNPGSGYLTKSENLVKSESKPDLTKLNLNSEGLATKNIKPVYQEKFQCGPYINNIITTESYSKSKSQNNRYHAQEFIKICENYQSNSNINQVVTFDEANNVLKYLNESPFKVQNEHDLKEEGDKSKENELLNLVSPHIINKLKQCHSATQELLKVFWNLFPINTKEKMSQLLKIKKSLEAYERGPLRQVEERMEGMREEIPASMLSDLKEQIRAATNKYDKYMEFYTGYCKSM